MLTIHRCHKGKTVAEFGWVPKSLMRELERLKKRIEKEKSKMATYARTRYFEEWHQHFRGMSKKSIWCELTRKGSEYPSLSTFYSHVRHSGLTDRLDEYFEFHRIRAVIRILGLDDNRLNGMIRRVEELARQEEMIAEKLRQQAVR